jgi:3'-phosphoadenosine 5'-phosphosulfate (PAPS) 3'-phosphatase
MPGLQHFAWAVQKVQLQLKAGEKQDKSDDSPVTIADYGKDTL